MGCNCHKHERAIGDDTQADRDAAAQKAHDQLTGLLKFTGVLVGLMVAVPIVIDLYEAATEKK